MSFIFALFQKVSDLFASPHLPLDSDYSYAARSREAERMRKAHKAKKIKIKKEGDGRKVVTVEGRILI